MVVGGNSRGTIHCRYTLSRMAESLMAPYGGTLLQRRTLFYNHNSDKRWRFGLWIWEYRLAGEGELAEQAGKRKQHFG